MGSDLNLAQRAIVLQVAVVHALVHSAFDGLVGVIVHVISLLLSSSELVCPI